MRSFFLEDATCDICGKRRGAQNNHSRCSKIRKRRHQQELLKREKENGTRVQVREV